MFQTYDDVTDPSVGPPRVAALRRVLATMGLDGFLIPRADQHQNEYVPDCWNRLRWITGFTGSAGAAIVMGDRAAAFTDGRYVQQIAAQVDAGTFDIVSTVETSVEAWLEQALGRGQRFGVDPWLHSEDQLKRLAKSVEKAGATLTHVASNPVDAAWPDRPGAPTAPIEPYPEALAGLSSADKIARLAKPVGEAGASHLVVCQPEAVAWLFNIRGGDIPHVPVALAWALVPVAGRPTLFVDPAKVTKEARASVSGVAEIAPYDAFASALATVAKGAVVLVDPAAAPAAIGAIVTAAGGRVLAASDPIWLMKARKTDAEIGGARAAQTRDGAAVARFLSWFDARSASGELDEIGCAKAMERFRRETNALKDLSFPSITGSGPNGAIIHYRVTNATNRKIDRDSLFLLDSGGQYQDGTTDITRTLAVGAPPLAMRQHFTLVLEGMIALTLTRFPRGTSGGQLDALARRALWNAGHDYDHGTGHGVGAYLSVHEGPARFAKIGSTVALEPGMILSNEPGFYVPGSHGIRIENLIVVTEPSTPRGGTRPMMGFETLTLAPIDRRLIVKRLLSAPARRWLDAYHARVLAEIGPLVDADTRAWLARACAPL